MSDDVEARVDELQEQVERLQDRSTQDQLESAALRQLVWRLAEGDAEDYDTIVRGVHSALDRVESMQERMADIEAENERLRSRLDKLGDIGAKKTSKPQKIAAIVTYAEQRRSDGQDALVVKPGTIKGLVDISDRYSYTLVDNIIDEYEWAHDPSEVQRYGAIGRAKPDKGVLIDFEGVHGDPVPLSKLINDSGEKGVAN
jgi:regulator of replication initiation timing